MTHRKFKVTFQPTGRTVHVEAGTRLLDAAAAAGFTLDAPCGGSGTCGKCKVRVHGAHCPPSESEIRLLGADAIAHGHRLACDTQVTAALVVDIPERSLLDNRAQILTGDSQGDLTLNPRIQKHFLSLSPAQREAAASDLELLVQTFKPLTPRLSALQALPGCLRKNNGQITAVTVGNDLIGIEGGDTRSALYGVAFDIGTTTLVGTLIRLSDGTELAVAARMNPQTSFGDDVVTRILKCRADAHGLAALQDAVIGAIRALLTELGATAGIDLHKVYEVVFAGNTTMQEILLGIDPSALGELPFQPAFRETVTGRAVELGLTLHPEAQFTVFPQVGGFVGGDTVAGILATRMDHFGETVLLVDIGTNGEIVLFHQGQLTATSVAAGPAFEGARIVNGMRGAAGAIEKFTFDGDMHWSVIGGSRPVGLCGTGLIDLTAELLRTGLLDPTGRILPVEEVPAQTPQSLRKRLVTDGAETHFLMATADETASGKPLLLYQRDIRELQLANGAIRAGINILLRQAGVEPEQLGQILLAGAFGNYIRRHNAKRIGMFPPIPTERIQFVGNAASFGAKRLLLAESERIRAAELGRKVRHIDLSLDPEFQMEFGGAMLFPESGE
jgi:uncharacterized 2Fe-2S/4Fe-4S cluster protein (DUF4445 family)